MAGNYNRNHLIEGPPLRAVLRLAGPMFVSAILQNLQSLIDLFWVGRLGSASVAALAISGTILMILFPVVMGVAAGTVALVSRAVGADDRAMAADAGGQSMVLALLFGVVVGTAGWFLADDLCLLLGAEEEVALLGGSYLRISFAGSFSVFLLFIGNSILQGAGNTVVPMCAMVASTLINMVLDPVMIFGLLGMPRLGVPGAALATVVAQTVAALAVVWVLERGHGTGIRVRARHWRPDWPLAWRLLRIGIPSSGQMLSRSLMSMVLMRIVASTGMVAVAAYGIGLRFHMLILMPSFTFGGAVATVVGQNLGAGLPRRARHAAWLTAGLDVGLMVVAALIIMPAAPWLIGQFDRSPEVVAMGTEYLRTVSPFYVFAALAIVLGRALMGAGDTVAPMILTIVCLWGLQVPLAIVLSRLLVPPTQGVWYAIAAAVTVHGVLTAAWFETGRWKTRRI